MLKMVCTINSGPPEPPNQLNIRFITAISATLSWQSRLDGGHPQTFQVLHHVAGTLSFSQNWAGYKIPDPGEWQIMNYTVTKLHPETDYQFQVVAENLKGNKTSIAVNVTTLGKL